MVTKNWHIDLCSPFRSMSWTKTETPLHTHRMRSCWGLLSKQCGVVARGTRLGPRSFELSCRCGGGGGALPCRNPPESELACLILRFFSDRYTRMPPPSMNPATGNKPMIRVQVESSRLPVHVDLSVLLIVTYNFDRAPIRHSAFKNLFKDV